MGKQPFVGTKRALSPLTGIVAVTVSPNNVELQLSVRFGYNT
jgi:hypothetical protein